MKAGLGQGAGRLVGGERPGARPLRRALRPCGLREAPHAHDGAVQLTFLELHLGPARRDHAEVRGAALSARRQPPGPVPFAAIARKERSKQTAKNLFMRGG